MVNKSRWSAMPVFFRHRTCRTIEFIVKFHFSVFFLCLFFFVYSVAGAWPRLRAGENTRRNIVLPPPPHPPPPPTIPASIPSLAASYGCRWSVSGAATVARCSKPTRAAASTRKCTTRQLPRKIHRRQLWRKSGWRRKQARECIRRSLQSRRG